MSNIGPANPAQLSALQAVQAQHAAAKTRDKEKTQAADAKRVHKDQADLRVDGVETNTAVRKLPKQSTEQEREEHEAHGQDSRKTNKPGGKKTPHIDLKA
jgi:predicted  nucleic acid-binding Zn-ribbon protein